MDRRAHNPCSRQPHIMSMDTNQALTMKSLAGQSRYLSGLFHFPFRFTSFATNRFRVMLILPFVSSLLGIFNILHPQDFLP